MVGRVPTTVNRIKAAVYAVAVQVSSNGGVFRDIPFDKLRASSRPNADENAGLRDDAK